MDLRQSCIVERLHGALDVAIAVLALLVSLLVLHPVRWVAERVRSGDPG